MIARFFGLYFLVMINVAEPEAFKSFAVLNKALLFFNQTMAIFLKRL